MSEYAKSGVTVLWKQRPISRSSKTLLTRTSNEYPSFFRREERFDEWVEMVLSLKTISNESFLLLTATPTAVS